MIDATALICLLFSESGASEVEAILPGALISALNYQEVQARLATQGVNADEIQRMLDQLDIEIVAEDADHDWFDHALVSQLRRLNFSPAERSCLALARRLGAVAVTADRRWSRLQETVTVKVVG